MPPDHFIRVELGHIGRQVEEPQTAFLGSDEIPDQLGLVDGVPIHDEEDQGTARGQQVPQKDAEYGDRTGTGTGHMKRTCPRGLMDEI